MIYLRNPKSIDNTWHFVLNDMFTDEELQIIDSAVKSTPDEDGNILKQDVDKTRDKIRKNTATWLENKNEMERIYHKLGDIFKYVNDAKFQFAIDFLQPLEYLTYNKDSYFDWHTDGPMKEDNTHVIRKISCSILLNEDYEGGDFNFNCKQRDWNIGRINKNSGLFFCSMIPHTITPVTSGVRKSLVSWACGPSFV